MRIRRHVLAAAVVLLAPVAALSLIEAPPPLLNVPTFSLATLGADGVTNMNILTYATPVGIKPVRRWAIALFQGTQTHANWVARRSGVLQLLCEPHAPLVHTLGGCSARDVDKAAACADLGFEWFSSAGEAARERLLPGCVTYLRLEQEGELLSFTGSEHDVAVCRVVHCLATPDGPAPAEQVSTARLRELGVISELGRAVPPE
jgi:hypothetical protein